MGLLLLAFMLTAGSPALAAPAQRNTPAARTPVVASAGGTVTIDDFQASVYDDGHGHKLPYRLWIPRGTDPRKAYPLVVFLHGAGGRGTDNRGQLTDQAAPMVFVQPANQSRWPVFMLAPQCPADQKWVDMPWGTPTGKAKQPAAPTWPMAASIKLVDEIERSHPAVDSKRLFVTGMSMGGFGSWDAAVRHPNKWKAAVIVCGGYDELAIAPLVHVHMPIWAFHAEDDPAVPVARSREMIAALRARGEKPRYTEYPATDHHGHFSWRPAYADPQLLPWMFGDRDGAAEIKR